MLPTGRRGEIPELNDSKMLTAAARERVYAAVVRRALAWSVVVIPAADCDRLGMHVADITGMRRALSLLDVRPGYVLSDGFRVDGLGVPGLAVPKGDAVAACVAAASVIAKVTRDALMTELHEQFPVYGFDVHKGYVTPGHSATLRQHGPCPEHRRRFGNVVVAMRHNGTVETERVETDSAEVGAV